MFPPRSQIETLGKEVMNMVDQKPDDMRLRWYCCAEILREPKITLKIKQKTGRNHTLSTRMPVPPSRCQLRY